MLTHSMRVTFVTHLPFALTHLLYVTSGTHLPRYAALSTVCNIWDPLSIFSIESSLGKCSMP